MKKLLLILLLNTFCMWATADNSIATATLTGNMKAIGSLVVNGGSINDYMGKVIDVKMPPMAATLWVLPFLSPTFQLGQ